VVHEGPRGAAARAGLADSFDDKEGYYTFTVRSLTVFMCGSTCACFKVTDSDQAATVLMNAIMLLT